MTRLGGDVRLIIAAGPMHRDALLALIEEATELEVQARDASQALDRFRETIAEIKPIQFRDDVRERSGRYAVVPDHVRRESRRGR